MIWGTLKIILSKVNKIAELLRKLRNILQRSALLLIYKAFARPYLHYSDTFYCQTSNSTFHQKLEMIQYNACLATTGTRKVSSKEQLYEELGLESPRHRVYYRKHLCWDTSTSSQVSNCDGVVLEIYLNHKFQWPQEGLNCESLAYEEVA